MVGKPVSLVQKLVTLLTKYFTIYTGCGKLAAFFIWQLPYIPCIWKTAVVVMAVAISVLMCAHVFHMRMINTWMSWYGPRCFWKKSLKNSWFCVYSTEQGTERWWWLAVWGVEGILDTSSIIIIIILFCSINPIWPYNATGCGTCQDTKSQELLIM
jgi:hypothetical protein